MYKCIVGGCVSSCRRALVARAIVPIFFSALLPNAALAAQSENTLSLQQAIQLTLQKNPELYQYRFTQKDLAAEKQQGALRPALRAALEAENVVSTNDNSENPLEVSLSLSSVIELGDKRSARLAVADAKFQQAQWQQQADTLSVLGELKMAFIEALATQASLTLAREFLQLQQDILATAKTRAKQGAASEVESLRAQSATAQAEIRVSELAAELKRQQVSISRFWNVTQPEFSGFEGSLIQYAENAVASPLLTFEADSENTDASVLADAIESVGLPAAHATEQAFDSTFKQLFSLLEKSPALTTHTAEVRVREAELKLAKTQQRGDVEWMFGLTRYQEDQSTGVSMGMSIPLQNKARHRPQAMAALARRDAIEYAKTAHLLALHDQLYSAYSLYQQSASAMQRLQTTALPALERALLLTREAYEQGRYRYTDLSTAQAELLAVKHALIQAAKSLLLSQAAIETLTSDGVLPH